MKKVLIITYYWPPSGGAGVQRWLKFVKYLREFGWEPIVYTPENPEPPDFDQTLLADIPENLTVIRRPVWEPYSIYKKFTWQKKSSRISHGFLKEDNRQGFAEKLSVWIRGNFFIPDARCFWIRPSIKFLSKYLKKNPVDAIVSSGPPHSMHMIALGLKKKLDIPWLADFRDPWTEIDFYDKLMLTRCADRRHKKLEKRVLETADMVISVGHHLAERLKMVGASKVEVITNGFDDEDFNFLPVALDDSFTITHIGSLNKDRNPDVLWQAISELCSLDIEVGQALRLRFVGKTDFSVKESLVKSGLINLTEFTSYLPHHEALKMAASSAVLLLLINHTSNQRGILTGKVFEYMATGRPTLGIGPVNGEIAKILSETKTGVICDFADKQGIIRAVTDYFTNRTGNASKNTPKEVGKYSRRLLTRKLADILNSIVSS